MALIIAASAAAQPPAKNADARPLAMFVDHASRAGLNAPNIFGGVNSKQYIIETTGTGVATFDYDNDGWLDIFFVNGTRLDESGRGATNQLFRNNHDGTFAQVTEQAGLRTSGWGQGACVGDIDNDGRRDLYVTYYGRHRLYRNLGGRFEEIAEKAGVAGNGKEWGTGCAFLDYDRDGLLDLAVANYVDFDLESAPKPGERASCYWKGVPVMCGPKGLKPSRNTLYHNLGNGKFENVTLKARFDKTGGHYCFSVSTLDYDQDGWTDVYIACDSTPSILYRNRGDGTFEDVAVIAGAAFNEDGREQAGMGSTVADFDGDGHLDIFRTNFSDDTSTLYRNNGDGSFTDVTFRAGLGLNTQYLGWGTMFFDFDNDSWPDLLLVNGHVYPEVDTHKLGSMYLEPKVLYRNRGDGIFVDVSKQAGPAITQATSARGLAIADLWNDGSLEGVITNMNALPNLLVNEQKYPSHWIKFDLEGSKSNRDAIGARLELRAGKRVLVNEVRSGSSYSSHSDMRVHFGLAEADKIDSLEVKWPSGLVERFSGLAVDKIHKIKEGSGTAAKR